jgi:hypothetical protein
MTDGLNWVITYWNSKRLESGDLGCGRGVLSVWCSSQPLERLGIFAAVAFYVAHGGEQARGADRNS